MSSMTDGKLTTAEEIVRRCIGSHGALAALRVS